MKMLIESATDTQFLIKPGRHIRFDVDRQSFENIDLTRFHVDRSLLEQAIGNIFDNARKYSNPGTNVDISGGYAFIAAGSAGLVVVDVSDRASPFVVAALDTTGNANDVKVVGDRAYVADGALGLQIIDVGDPLLPSLLGNFDTADAWDVDVIGGLAFLADGAAAVSGLPSTRNPRSARRLV